MNQFNTKQTIGATAALATKPTKRELTERTTQLTETLTMNKQHEQRDNSMEATPSIHTCSVDASDTRGDGGNEPSLL